MDHAETTSKGVAPVQLTARSTSTFRLVGRLVAALAVVATMIMIPPAVAPVAAAEVRDITLPVPADAVGTRTEGGVYWSDTYGACRSGCSRSHEGVDMLGPKLTPLIAANDGYISWLVIPLHPHQPRLARHR